MFCGRRPELHAAEPIGDAVAPPTASAATEPAAVAAEQRHWLEFTGDGGSYFRIWIVNLFLVDTPFSTLTKIRDMMPFDAYENRALHWLKEPPRDSGRRTIAMP